MSEGFRKFDDDTPSRAAAPDLLAAHREILSILTEDEPEHPHKCRCTRCRAIRVALSAIARVTGEAT